MGSDSATAAIGEAGPLPPHLRDAYLARSRLVKVRRGAIIMTEGGESKEVYLICSGKVQVLLLSPHGREVILRDLGPDRIFGETGVIDGLPRSANIVALEDCVLAHMRAEEFLAFIDTVPGAGLWTARMLAGRLRDVTERAFELATLPVAARVHTELLRLAAETGVTGDYVLISKMPRHADLAARIGTHREAVTRELNLLAGEGILRQSGREVEILSLAKLQSLYDRMRR